MDHYENKRKGLAQKGGLGAGGPIGCHGEGWLLLSNFHVLGRSHGWGGVAGTLKPGLTLFLLPTWDLFLFFCISPLGCCTET